MKNRLDDHHFEGLRTYLTPEEIKILKNKRRGKSIVNVSEEEMKEHLRIRKYGSFELTGAVRPAYDLSNIPEEGYMEAEYNNTEASIPVIICSLSREKLWNVFSEIVGSMTDFDDQVDVVLQSSHDVDEEGRINKEYFSEETDLVVVQSYLSDDTYETVLTNDGCAGIAVIAAPDGQPMEVQLDEHKVLFVYGNEKKLRQAKNIVKSYGVQSRANVRTIIDGEHLHSSSEELHSDFERLRQDLGAETD